MTLRCAVIGAGVVGAAAALELSARGAQVSLFDQFIFAHKNGSSHGPSRLLRIAYFEHPDYVPLALSSIERWRSLEVRSGEKIFLKTGVLEAGPPDGFLIGGTREAAARHGLAITELIPAQIAERFPWLTLQDGDEAVFEPDAGMLLADRAMAAFSKLALYSGVKFFASEKVLGWKSAGGDIRLQTTKQNGVFDRIVVAAGAWSPEILGADLSPVSSVEKSLFWVAKGHDRFRLESGFAPFAIETSGSRMFYGFPAIDESGVKAAEHTGGAPMSSPDAKRNASLSKDRGAVKKFLERYAPAMPAQIGREETCLYEMSPDGHFMIGRRPDDDRISFAAGLSGHGFKFAPVIGHALAKLAFDEDLPREFDFLNPARFRRA